MQCYDLPDFGINIIVACLKMVGKYPIERPSTLSCYNDHVFPIERESCCIMLSGKCCIIVCLLCLKGLWPYSRKTPCYAASRNALAYVKLCRSNVLVIMCIQKEEKKK